uniref:Secreted protein n=1 Tax=Plectus sambesii TaxID=2011161 RepID=A0A914WLC2_9BILA
MKSLITVTLLLCAFSSTILAKNPTSEEKRLSPLIKRTLACVQSANNPKASCTVEAEGEKVRPADCFEEVSKEDKKPRMYCKISCKNGPVSRYFWVLLITL